MCKLRSAFRERHNEILKARQLQVKEKMRKAEETRKNKLKQLEDYTRWVSYYGLWQSEREVENSVASLESKTEKID